MKKITTEDFSSPVNSMSSSSSIPGSGGIDSYDTPLKQQKRRRLKRFREFIGDKRRTE